MQGANDRGGEISGILALVVWYYYPRDKPTTVAQTVVGGRDCTVVVRPFAFEQMKKDSWF